MEKYLYCLLLSLWANQASGAESFKTGNEFLQQCNRFLKEKPETWDDVAQGSVCYGYVQGISDLHAVFTDWGDIKLQWCVPEGTRASQLALVAAKYMEAHPEQLESTAASLVANAFIDAYPCN